VATFKANDLNRDRFMGGYGNGWVGFGTVTPTAGASGDIYYPMLIPAGVMVTDVDIVNDDLDSNGAPTIACKVGYSPVNSADGPSAVDDYFAAAGKTFLNATGRTSLAFQPIKFDKPVYLIVTLTAAAATFASGKVTAIVKGDALGVK
jgi:hypothetical protein